MKRPVNRHVVYPKTLTYRELKSGGKEEVWYEVSLDLQQIHGMAHRAAASKGQQSTDGPVKVRILERREITNGR